jgi:dihydrolipoamide dehydrogenase
MYDLLVIGAGPGGYEAAAHAARNGFKVGVIEERALGGTCLNEGCIPTKAFLRSSRLFAECQAAKAYGILVGQPEIDMSAVVRRKDRIVGMLGRGVATLMKRSGVEVIRGRARITARRMVRVGSEELEARNVLIATGSKPAVPPIPGIDSALDSTAILNLTRVPETMSVIGGGYIGLEFAAFFAAVGSKVTVIEMLPRVAAGADHDIADRLHQSLVKSGVTIQTSAKVTRVDGQCVHYRNADGTERRLSAECVLNATGRVPVVQDLGLEDAGVDFSQRGIRTSDRGRTSAPGIWACGDVTGRRLLAHAATREGIVAVNNMLGRNERIRYDALPSVIYTHPEVASVGETEDELRALGVEYRKSLTPMAVAGRFLVENEGAHGLVKVLTGARHGEILGVHALGDLSSEFIVTAAAMMESGMTAADIGPLIFPHPTVGEALKEAVLEAGAARSH